MREKNDIFNTEQPNIFEKKRKTYKNKIYLLYIQ